MPNARLLATLPVLWALATPCHAARMVFAWDAEYVSDAYAMTLVATTSAGTQQIQPTLALLPEAECQTHAGSSYDPRVTKCGAIPCPAPGAYAVTLQGNTISPPSNVVTFGIGGPSCTVIPYDKALLGAQASTPVVSTPPASRPTGETPEPPPGATLPTSPAPSTQEMQRLMAGPKVSDEEAQQIAALQTQASALHMDYRAELRRSHEAWLAVLAKEQGTPATPERQRRIWEHYTKVEERRARTYQRILEHWRTLLAKHEALANSIGQRQ